MNPLPKLSDRTLGIPGALSIYMNELVYQLKRQGNDIITLSLGEAFFDIPMFDFAKLDFVKGYHYSDSQGLPELRRAIASFYKRQYGVEVNGAEEIIVSAGSKVAIYLAILATVNRGERVLIHEPAWLSYQEQIRLVDGIPAFIPYDVEVKDFGPWFTPDTRMLIINNPNNPAGRIYSREDLATLVEMCKANRAWLLVDEAYSDFLEPGEFCSILEHDPSREVAIVANSLSKNMGMSGWRIGYLISNPSLVREVIKLNQHIITCAPTILQSYLAHYFDDIIAATLPQARDVAKKRSRVECELEKLGLKALGGSATFYFFVSVSDFPGSSLDLCLYLLLFHNISVVPGHAYGESTAGFVRVAIGTESEERIKDALTIISHVLRNPPDVHDLVTRRLSELGLKSFTFAHA